MIKGVKFACCFCLLLLLKIKSLHSEKIPKICQHLIAPQIASDFSGKVGLILASGLVTSCCSQKTACWRPACCWLQWGSRALVTPLKGGSVFLKKNTPLRNVVLHTKHRLVTLNTNISPHKESMS